MFDRIAAYNTNAGGRLLARRLARELTIDELPLVGGGQKQLIERTFSSSSCTTCSDGAGGPNCDDGGADD